MKRALTQKLHEQKGASMILALLFLLICATVASVILMAAVSNAGKLHSNEKEHQAYMALSSAVGLLCDEITRAEYRGRYTYTEVLLPESGALQKHLQQTAGSYTGDLEPVLRLGLDYLFGQEIINSDTVTGFKEVAVQSAVALEHELTITPQTGTPLDDQTVIVELRLIADSYAIELTATLGDYRIEAELTPKTSKPVLPSSLDKPGEVQNDDLETEPLQWKIGWVVRGDNTIESGGDGDDAIS